MVAIWPSATSRMSNSPADSDVIFALTDSESARLRSNFSKRARQREGHWLTPHFGRKAGVFLVAAALIANLAWIIGLDLAMFGFRSNAVDRGAIQVSVIEPLQVYELPPEPQPQPIVFQRRVSKVQIAPPETKLTPPPRTSEATNQTQARMGISGAAPVVLFNTDGSLRLPTEKILIGPDKIDNPQEAGKARWAEIQKRGENPLDCTRTRFAGQFRTDQSAGDRIAGKYLSWIGLADQQGIAERAAEREQRAAEGCDPPRAHE